MANRRIARADHLHAAIKPFLPNKIGRRSNSLDTAGSKSKCNSTGYS